MPEYMCLPWVFFFLCIVDRCRSLSFPLVFLVIDGGDFVLSRVRSKKQPPSLLRVSAAAVGMLFAPLLCVWEPQAQVPSPPSPARVLPVLLWRMVNGLGSGTFTHGCVLPCWAWSDQRPPCFILPRASRPTP